jgi:hypothetical protein
LAITWDWLTLIINDFIFLSLTNYIEDLTLTVLYKITENKETIFNDKANLAGIQFRPVPG